MNDFFVGAAVLVAGALLLLAIAAAVVTRLICPDPDRRAWKALAKRQGWALCGDPRFTGKFGKAVWDMQACEAADDLPDDEPCTLLDFYGLPPSPDRCAIMTEQAWRQLQDKKAPRNGISGLIVDELPERFDFTAAGCSVVPISDLRWPESMVMVATAPEWARLWSNDVARLWRDWPGVPAESISLVLMNGTMRLKVQRAALTSENDLLRLWDTGALLLATTHGR